MHEAVATPSWVLIAYLVAGVCFILALRGLSSPESSRRGNRLGMLGMLIAVGTTLVTHDAVALASVNIFGGFAVTQRMLSMYKKRERRDA